MNLPLELLQVFFEVIGAEEFYLFGKLACLCKEGYQYSVLHKRAFADRVSKYGRLPNGVFHGEVNIGCRSNYFDDGDTFILERYECGRLRMRLEQVDHDEAVEDDENTLWVYNDDEVIVYVLTCYTHNDNKRHKENINLVTRYGESEIDHVLLKFRQSYEEAIRPLPFTKGYTFGSLL